MSSRADETPAFGCPKLVPSLVLGVVTFVVALRLSGTGELRLLRDVRVLPALLGGGCTLLINLAATARWRLLVANLCDHAVRPFGAYLDIFMISRALGQVIPESLSVLGARPLWLQNQEGLALTAGGYSVLLDRLFDVLTMGLILVPGVLSLSGLVSPATGVLGVVVLTSIVAILFHLRYQATLRLLLAGYIRLGQLLARLFARVPILGRKFERFLNLDTDAGFRAAPGSRALFWLTLVKTGSVVLRAYLYARAFGLAVPLAVILLGVGVVQMSYVFALTPGNLGILELGWTAVFSLMNVESDAVPAFLLGQRVLTVLAILLITLIVHMVERARRTPAAPHYE